MKNKLKIGTVLVLAISTFAFTTITDKKVDVKNSTVVWNGYKVTGEHEGTLSLKEGSLTFNGDKLAGGKFVVDMTSLTVTDLEGGMKGKLEGHLKSDDFFGVEKHPEAALNITKVEGSGGNYKVTGALTIKGITNVITFDMNVKGNTATAAFKVDRSKFDVRFGSPSFFNDLQDKAIYDEFDLNVTLKF
ncbi:polyisoprenoid-binding protein YceI [Flavobacteriaceae bacterium MAR_2010_72]|nr:polyisoprenoid-binding protein YceI [Flavobacteriaceae bacterium MAR_2010_72]TVZ58972.1 polyisoprenoid-binding protein YceI [Flavobacteriaceae bacterium MAR_2010_105]